MVVVAVAVVVVVVVVVAVDVVDNDDVVGSTTSGTLVPTRPSVASLICCAVVL